MKKFRSTKNVGNYRRPLSYAVEVFLSNGWILRKFRAKLRDKYMNGKGAVAMNRVNQDHFNGSGYGFSVSKLYLLIGERGASG